MKLAVTGHISGLGKYIYDHFASKATVQGLSRSNGFDISTAQQKIVETVSGVDVFINCAHYEDFQKQLLLSLINKVENIVVIGTSMQMFDDFLPLTYIQHKRNLSDCCRSLSIDPSVNTHILLINISFLPRSLGSVIATDNNIEYQDVIDAIEYWLKHKNISEITFSWKMTDLVFSEFEKVFPHLKVNRPQGYKND